ncbi:unnamed protein product [Effrenium voratum]|nr:unnamed protein product [Effrenium voratum]
MLPTPRTRCRAQMLLCKSLEEEGGKLQDEERETIGKLQLDLDVGLEAKEAQLEEKVREVERQLQLQEKVMDDEYQEFQGEAPRAKKLQDEKLLLREERVRLEKEEQEIRSSERRIDEEVKKLRRDRALRAGAQEPLFWGYGFKDDQEQNGCQMCGGRFSEVPTGDTFGRVPGKTEAAEQRRREQQQKVQDSCREQMEVVLQKVDEAERKRMEKRRAKLVQVLEKAARVWPKPPEEEEDSSAEGEMSSDKVTRGPSKESQHESKLQPSNSETKVEPVSPSSKMICYDSKELILANGRAHTDYVRRCAHLQQASYDMMTKKHFKAFLAGATKEDEEPRARRMRLVSACHWTPLEAVAGWAADIQKVNFSSPTDPLVTSR